MPAQAQVLVLVLAQMTRLCGVASAGRTSARPARRRYDPPQQGRGRGQALVPVSGPVLVPELLMVLAPVQRLGQERARALGQERGRCRSLRAT